MKALFINPPEYTFSGYHNIHTYPTDLYNWATLYKERGHSVEMFDMYPELANSSLITSIDGYMYYDGEKIVEDIGVLRKCGNYENEHLVRGVLKTGFPYSVLESKLQEETYDEIIVCAMGSKTGVSSTSWIYVFMGAYEVINRCKQYQPNAKVVLMGEYTKICPSVASSSLADVVSTDPAPTRHFINTDVSLFEKEVPNRINIATSYGCSNCCAFCFIPKCEWSFRTEKPVQDVIDYMESIINQGYTRFRFLDSNLLANWDTHLKLILDEIVSKGWNVSLTSYGGVEPAELTDDKAELMVQAGFREINVPLDNSDPEVLELWGSIKTVEAWEAAVDIAKKYFDTVYSYVMIGYPGQTYTNLTNSIDMCDAKGAVPSLLPYTPMPGTIYEDNTKNPEALHPLLFPYASPELTVAQLENILEERSPWYKKSTITPSDIVHTKRIYTSSPAIPIN